MVIKKERKKEKKSVCIPTDQNAEIDRQEAYHSKAPFHYVLLLKSNITLELVDITL